MRRRPEKTILEAENYSWTPTGGLFRMWISRTKNLDQLAPVAKLVCVPRKLRTELLQSLHDRETTHAGQTKLLLTLRGMYYCKSQFADVQSWVESCTLCQSVKPKPQHARLQQFATPQIMNLVKADLCGPLQESPTSARYVAIFVVHATLYCELAAMKHCDAVTVATVFVEQWCSRYGFPRQLVTDLGPCYANELMRTVCDLPNVKLGHVAHNTINQIAGLSTFVKSSYVT
jgi:hypothetical protein